MMNKFYFSIFASLFVGNLCAQHAYIEQQLLDHMAYAKVSEMIPVVVMLEDVVDVQALKSEMQQQSLPVSRRPQAVMSVLKAKAAATQPALLTFLGESNLPHSNVQRFWITNSIGLSANVELIEALAARSDVAYISYDVALVGEVDHLKSSSNFAKSAGGIEPGLAAIGAPEMWALGYTGQGRMAMTFDSGVWPDHPAITDRFLPNIMPLSSTWYPFDSQVPTDKPGSHGTHVSGTMLGLHAETADTIGVAFGTYFIATDPTVSSGQTPKPLTSVMLGFEWAMNPDGNDETSDDVPDVINNSWGRTPSEANPPCAPFVISTFEAVEAAGIASVFAAGNDGPEPETIGVPKNTNMGLVNSFAVGAVNASTADPTFPIANFSSRGPSLCEAEGSLHIKPEVSAPGVNVRSAVDSDSYASFSGTSMAAPHTSGAALLLKEAFPFLTGEEILLALYYSAIDLGEPGEDNTYGMGIINIKLAFDYLSQMYDPVPPATRNVDLELVSIDEPSELVQCSLPGTDGLTPVVTVRNKGLQNATELTIRYAINGGNQSVYTAPNFNLPPGEEMQVLLPPIVHSGLGFTELHARIDPLPQEYDIFNNNNVKRWLNMDYTQDSGSSLFDNFDEGLAKWLVINPDNERTWDTVYTLQSDGSMGYAARMRFLEYLPIAGQKDDLISLIVTSPENTMHLSFDYFYRRFSASPTIQDTVVVSVISNCMELEHELWRKGGADLWTNDINGADNLPESVADWQNIQLQFDLSIWEGYNPENGYAVKFTGINRNGNSFLLDNVNIGNEPLSVTNREEATALSLSPNPGRDWVRLTWDARNSMLGTASIYNMYGKMVAQKAGLNSGATIDINGLAQGIYIVEVRLDDNERTKAKLVVQ